MSEQQQQSPDSSAAAGPPELEQIPVTRGERVAAVVGLLVLAALALVCIDLATGGKLSARVGGVPASSTAEGGGAEPCADC